MQENFQTAGLEMFSIRNIGTRKPKSLRKHPKMPAKNAARLEALYPGPAIGGDGIILQLLREAIENELTAPQRNTLKAVWYDRRKVSELSQAEMVSEQTIRKRLKQCQNKLETALRYAVRYAQLRSLYCED